MTALTVEKTGKISVENGSTAVTGTDTLFSDDMRAVEGGFLIVAGLTAAIASVESDTAMTLEENWAGEDATDTTYVIIRSTAEAARLINAQDKLADLIQMVVNYRFLDFAAAGTNPDLSERTPYDDEEAGFRWALLPEAGTTGYAKLYTKNSATSGDWSGGTIVHGPPGPQGTPGSAAVVGTSATSLTIGTGEKVLAVQANRGWGVGARLRAASDADPSNWMEGTVDIYSGTSLTLDVDLVGGSGTFADWTINIAGEPGAGIAGSLGSTDNRLLRSDGTGGATAQGSGVTLTDAGAMSGVSTLETTGNAAIAGGVTGRTLTVGNATGSRLISLWGGTGTNEGGALLIEDGGALTHAFGTLSAIYGGAYNGTFLVYSLNNITLNPAGGTALIFGDVVFGNYGAGTLQTDASGNVTASSDERLKTDIVPFERGLAAINQLEPISFHWSPASGLDQMTEYSGFSAQNVEDAIPEAVGVGANGYLTVSDRAIIAALVNAVKELSQQNVALVARIEALEA